MERKDREKFGINGETLGDNGKFSVVCQLKILNKVFDQTFDHSNLILPLFLIRFISSEVNEKS